MYNGNEVAIKYMGISRRGQSLGADDVTDTGQFNGTPGQLSRPVIRTDELIIEDTYHLSTLSK